QGRAVDGSARVARDRRPLGGLEGARRPGRAGRPARYARLVARRTAARRGLLRPGRRRGRMGEFLTPPWITAGGLAVTVVLLAVLLVRARAAAREARRTERDRTAEYEDRLRGVL